MGIGDLGKRLLIGRKLRSAQLRPAALPKRIAMPVYASDPLSSVAYAPDEIFLLLALAGISAYTMSWKVALAIAVVMIAVIASYRQNVRAYQSGGGDYEVSSVNLGSVASLMVASALLVDYVLTVAVSLSAVAQYAATAIPALQGHQTTAAVGVVLFVMAMNLRGIRTSGRAFAIPVYLFIASVLGMAIVGFVRYAFDGLPLAASSELSIAPVEEFEQGFTGLAAAFLILRAFSSGCVALTGVEAVANSVPQFRKPRGKNAATTLALLGGFSIVTALSVVVLANLTQVRVAEDPARQLLRPNGTPVGDDYHQDPLISQIAGAAFSGFFPAFYLVIAATGVILVLAANTAFNGFPVLGSILGRAGYLPRQLHTRGDRLVYSNGILLLAGFAILLIVAFQAKVTSLIQLYIVGVFVAFTLGQTGMVVHWTRRLRNETDPAARRRMRRSRFINGFGLSVTGIVLVVVLLTKFGQGAWISILAMAIVFGLMRGIHRHYDRVAEEIAPERLHDMALPSRVHSVVLVSKLHRPALRALAFARAAKPDLLEAITVDVDSEETRALSDGWDEHEVDVQLKVLASPYREITRPVVEYVKSIHRASPRDVVMVYVPEYVVGRWWERFLHNQSALRLRMQLRFIPGVTVTSVPYQLRSSKVAVDRMRRENGTRGKP